MPNACCRSSPRSPTGGVPTASWWMSGRAASPACASASPPRALAFAWQAALSGYGTAAIVAAAARERHDTDGPIAVAITGGHGELFWQRFDAQTLAPEAPPVSVPIAELAARVDDPVIYGSGAQALVDARGHGTAVPVDADSASFPALPDDALLAPTPVYGRGADAKPMAVRTGSGT